ncbi:MAG: hypothetical protein WCJ30_03440 [Deltaproteobacteria bacterium]
MSAGTSRPDTLSIPEEAVTVNSTRLRRPFSSRSLRVRALALALALSPAAGLGQQMMHRPVNAGDVTGLEMSIEGAQHAPRGGRMRWTLAVHEVVGLSDLRPAQRTHVRLLSSLVRDHAVAEVDTDARGRAEVALDVPQDAPGTFHVVFEAVSPRNVRRQFDLDVTADPARVMMLETDRTVVRPGDTVTVWGRVSSAATQLPLANETVRFDVQDPHGRNVLGRVELHTDAAGGFHQRVALPPRSLDRFTFTAATGRDEFTTRVSASVQTALPSAPALILGAAPAQTLARPGEPVRVQVVLRTGDGRPVRSATVTSPLIPVNPLTREQFPIRTDARGRASFTFTAPEVYQPYRDMDISVSAVRTGIGSASASTRVRVARSLLFGAVAVEGGALVPGVPGRLYVRVVRADGSAAGAGVHLTLRGPRFATGLEATTDADGAASIETTLTTPSTARPARPARPAATTEADEEAAPAESEDHCGGGTATGFEIALLSGAQQGAVTGCVPIDPDGTVRVRTPDGPFATAGQPLHITLVRASAAMHLPIEVAVLARRDTWVPLVAQVIAPEANEVTLTLPADAAGLASVRVRPLHGSVAMPVRGGMTSVWVAPGARFALAAEVPPGGADAIVHATGSTDGVSGMSVVLPRGDGESLFTRIGARPGAAPLGDLRVDPGRVGAALVAGALAAVTPLDDAAPAVLRGGRITPVPAPERPGERGTLRDPWRARARFVEGRLALLFRQIEQHVADSLASGRDNVAVRAPAGRWSFNREIFDAILATSEQSGSTGPRALGGDPLTIEVLQRLDPAFTYDNVARRVTRRRLFAALLALRRFVNEHSLDLRWSWRGDPSTWLRSIVTDGVAYDEEGSTLSQSDLLDGWGHPFALRPAVGGRARFTFLVPVQGYELVSSGPDERFGTADDMVNPFARILPAGGAYGRAVDEDALLARLNGVELGRATISRLATVFEVETGSASGEGEADSQALAHWDEIPARIEDDPHALDVVRPAIISATHVEPLAAVRSNDGFRIPLGVDDEPRTYAVVVDAWSVHGFAARAIQRFTAGTPLLVDLPIAPAPDETHALVPRLRVGEPVRIMATVTNLADDAQQLGVDIRGTEAIIARGPTSVSVPPGETASLELVLDASRAGRGDVQIALRDGAGRVLRRVSAPIIADQGSLGVRDDRALLVSGTTGTELSVDVPSARHVTSSRVVITAPSALADDPEFDRVRRLDPALIAWAYTLATRELPSALAADLLQAQEPGGPLRPLFSEIGAMRRGGPVFGASPAISTACALVAWSAAPEDDTTAAQARALAARVLPSLRGTIPDGAAGTIREAAAVLAALATGGAGGAPEGDEAVDPVAAYAEHLRAQLREVQRSFPTQPTLLARAAAALLLTDPADGRGIAMFDLARRAVVRHGGFASVRGGDGRTSQGEETMGTAALAIAAQQRGEVSLAAELARTVAARAHLSMRLGGESAFWLLATVSYGVYGLANPEAVDLTVNGSTRRIPLVAGRAIVPLTANDGHTAARVTLAGREAEAGLAFARLEVLSDWTFTARTDSPLRFTLQGDPGFADETSALELSVQNGTTQLVSRPIVEILLPAATHFDDGARAALAARPHVAQVEARDGGIVRITFDALGPSESVELPLAVQWLARGRISDFSAVGYREDQPAALTIMPPRVIDLRTRPPE